MHANAAVVAGKGFFRKVRLAADRAIHAPIQ